MGRHETLGIEPELDGAMWHHHPPTPTMHRPHTHRELECNLVLRGHARYIVDDQRYDLTRGTLIWLHPAQEHVLVDQSPNYEMWIAVFKPRMLRRVCQGDQNRPLRHHRPGDIFCKQLAPATAEALSALALSLVRPQPPAAEFNCGLAFFLLRAWRAHREAGHITPSSDVHPAVERAARIVREAAAPMSLEAIAERAGLSPSRLSRVFKQQTGISLVQYRQRVCLERFMEIHGRGRRYTLAEAALRAGFGSYPQFHRVFKKAFGYPPAEYRRRLNDA